VRTREVTRRRLRRELAVNAATKPVNVTVPAAVAVGAFVLGAPWLLAVAAVLYVVLAVMTFFDEGEAERVGRAASARARGALPSAVKLDADIRAQLEAARRQEGRIAATAEHADLPFAEVREEAARLVAAVEDTAVRAQRLRDELDAQDRPRLQARLRQLEAGPPDPERAATARAVREQCAVLDELERRLEGYRAEMERVNASLGAVHGRLVQAAVASDEARGRELAGDVRDLRERVETLTQTMAEALQSDA
jgi:hypothetical protein